MGTRGRRLSNQGERHQEERVTETDTRRQPSSEPAREQSLRQGTLGLGGRVSPSGSTLRAAFALVTCRRHLASTLLTALVVGTVLFCINQLDVVLRGKATALVWFKTGLTYVVPFVSSNIGILIATHRPSPETEV
jgi:hypothetical protein